MAKKPFKSKKLSLYSNLINTRKIKKTAEAKKRAHYIASLPKNPVKRFFYRAGNALKPKNFVKYWFSKHGLITLLKIIGVFVLLIALFIGGLFVYFRKDLDAIRPGELAKNVQSSVNTYLDRNGEVLWEDKGEGNYKLVVDGANISQYLKDATVAIEDRDFYKHSGVSISGITRAFFNNLSGGNVQGGSTLTQQLVKQVFFADEAQERGISGIPRKIKELVLSIEVERMYNKEQILNLYLNESPYGGRRNGAESGAQTYFGKPAKDLTIAEASLLAAIPQSPSVYNPYNIAGHEGLIERQHIVLDNMVNQGYITKEQADEAKEYPIIDNILPETTQFINIRAPHFVQMVRAELEQTLGKATVGKGGLTIKTTLDIRIQTKLEEAMNSIFSSNLPNNAGFSNGASTVEDTKTGQIVALMGSRDFNYPGYGQDNAATAYIQPGSTVKPLVYSKLFEKKPAGQVNYGSGSILKDENINAIYGSPVFNADRSFKGNVTIRFSLATSRNIPAIKAMYISGIKPTIDNIRALGATSYCTQGDEVNVGLSAAIGGCGIKQIDLVNGFASLARQGVYKPQSSVLEVKNSFGETLQKWADVAGDQIVDPQSAYIVNDILSDDNARSSFSGRNYPGLVVSGVKTASKTGTSDKGGQSKDVWMMSYSPVLTMSVWFGNSDASVLRSGNSLMPAPVINKVMEYSHKEIYAPQGLWKSGDWFVQPSGIQKVGIELYPSWWNKNQGITNSKLTFDKISKFRATDFTPIDARIELDVIKSIDPITKTEIITAPEGYDATKEDNVHLSTTAKPTVTLNIATDSNNTSTITANVTPGAFALSSVEVKVGDTILAPVSNYVYTYTSTASNDTPQVVTVTVIDSGLYRVTGAGSVPEFKAS